MPSAYFSNDTCCNTRTCEQSQIQHSHQGRVKQRLTIGHRFPRWHCGLESTRRNMMEFHEKHLQTCRCCLGPNGFSWGVTDGWMAPLTKKPALLFFFFWLHLLMFPHRTCDVLLPRNRQACSGAELTPVTWGYSPVPRNNSWKEPERFPFIECISI